MVGYIIFPSELTDRCVKQIIASGADFVGLHPGNPDCGPLYLEDMASRMQDPAFLGRLQALRKAGIAVEIETHAMHWLMPRHHFAEHPDWFRMVDGKRVADANLCPCNAEGMQVLEDNAAKLAALFPSPQTHRYFFWLDDSVAGVDICHCQQCRDLSASDQAMLIYNRVLKGVRRTDPLATHCYLAYIGTIAPPTKVKPDPGIFLEYAPISRSKLGFALNDERCRENGNETDKIRELLDLFGRENAQALDYWLDNSRYYNWRPPYGELPFFPATIRADARYYKDLGFAHITNFACRMGEDYVERYGEAPLAAYVDIVKKA